MRSAKRGFYPGKSSRLKGPLVERMYWRGLFPPLIVMHNLNLWLGINIIEIPIRHISMSIPYHDMQRVG